MPSLGLILSGQGGMTLFIGYCLVFVAILAQISWAIVRHLKPRLGPSA